MSNTEYTFDYESFNIYYVLLNKNIKFCYPSKSNVLSRCHESFFDILCIVVNYLVASIFPPLASKAQNDKIKNAKHYIWDDPYLWKLCSDQVIR